MDAPETIQPEQTQAPAIIDPQMDTNKVYEQEHERQHAISDDQPTQLAQNDVPTYTLGSPAGLLEPGNIDLNNRPLVHNADGSHSTEYSTSFGDEKGREVLVPTVVNGKFLTPDGRKPAERSPAEKAMFRRAQAHYEQTHEHMGIFDSPENSDAYANIVHNRQDARVPTSDTHNIVQAPDGAKVAFPKGTSPETMHAEMTKWWQPRVQQAMQAWDAVRNAASNAAQAIGLPSDMPELQLQTDEFMRDPVGKTGDVVGAVVGGLAHGFNAIIPNTTENRAMVQRAQAEHAQGNNIAAATTLVPLVGDGLAKAVKQAQDKDFSGSIGTTLGVAAPFLTETFKAEPELPVSREQAYAGAERRAAAASEAPAYAGAERRGALMSPTEIENNLKTGRPVYTPFDSTEGAMDTINRDLATRLEKQPEPVAVNASGESAASQEAINRTASQKVQGIKTFRVDSRTGNATPVLGVDAADATAHPYEHVVQVKDGQVTVQDSGKGARPLDEQKLLKQTGGELPKQIVGTAEGAVRDSELFAQAKQKLGPDASFSQIATEAQRMKTAGEDVPIQVRHWSKQRVPLTETNPEMFGTGRAGAERSRANEPGFLPRTYFGMDGYREPEVQSGLEHTATLDRSKYYDINADKDGIWQKGFQEGGATAAEKAVKDAGYSGYYSPEQQVAASFDKVPVKVRKGPVAEAADSFNAEHGRPPVEHKIVSAPEHAKAIADEYEHMAHDPNNPAVQRAYGAMKNDIDEQWDYATKKMGITMEPWTGEGQPYKNSKEMTADVKNNKHLYFFTGGDMPVDHPLAEDAGEGLNYNDKLRAVHDLFGHAANDNQFGPQGEERAWQEHRQMFSPEAIPAVTTETRGQNSWVNFGPHLRDAEGNIPGKGEPGAIPPAKRPFAEQKAGLLPEWATRPEGVPTDAATAQKTLEHIKSGKPFAILTAENPLNTRIGDAENAARNAALEDDLKARGYEPTHVIGNNRDVAGEKEHSLFVPGISPEEAAELGRKHGQQAVLTNEGLHDLQSNTIMPSDNTNVMLDDAARKQPYYSTVGGQDFSVPLGESEPKQFSNLKEAAKNLWTDETGTYTSGQFMKYLAKNKLMSKAGQDTLETASKEKVVPGWAEVSKFLTPEDRAQASASVQRNVVDLVNKFNPKWVEDAAKAGSAAKGWYSRATALIDHMFGDEAHRFTNFVASLSPQKDVEQNLTDALNFYNLWQEAGKPLGPENEKVIRDLTERAEVGMSGQVARNQLYENLVNDVQPTGPKVSNFARNLKGNMDAVTKDRWMAYLFGNNDRMFRWFKEGSPKPAVHMAADALVRAVGQNIGMLPAEVQETAWSFLRTVVNLTEKQGISTKAAVGSINDALIREGASDLTRLIADSPKVQSALNRLATATGDERFRAVNLQNSPKFKQLLAEHQTQAPTAGGIGATNRAGLERGVNKAIEARSSLSKEKTAKAKKAAAKSQAPKVDKDTEFNPDDLSNNFTPSLSNKMREALS
jgi:hypothetical protein